MTDERISKSPNQRRLKVDGNALLPSEITFRVCGEDAEPGSILYFRPIDPLDDYDISNLLGQGEEINQTELAWRIAGKKQEKAGERPPGTDAKTAAELRRKWRREGLIETFDGPNNAKMMRRKTGQELKRA